MPDPPSDARSDAKVKDLEEQLAARDRELEAKEREVDRIAGIQQDLLPSEPPALPGFAIAASHVAPERAGGDYYDFLPDYDYDDEAGGGRRCWFIVADASGHGPASAVIMAMVHSILHAYAKPESSPGSLMRFVNEQMAKKDVESSFVTALIGVIDPASRALRFACAGHHLPLVRRTDGVVEELDTDRVGPPLSVDADAEFGTSTYSIRPGETLLLYTDGALEEVDPDGAQFGLERLCTAFAAADPEEALRSINRAIAAHRRGGEQSDDKTLVALHALSG